MKKIMLMTIGLLSINVSHAQYFNEELTQLYNAALENNDTLQLYKIKQDIAGVNIRSTQFNYLPKIGFGASYTRLNDDIVFPDNMQKLLLGTQSLLIKEALGVPFNQALPPNVPLQAVDPIQRKDIFKTTLTGQWLLFSGGKVGFGVKAYQHQQKALGFLSQKQQTKLWLEVSDVYDKMALLQESDAIIHSSENILEQQTKFVNAAISNGLATPLDRKKLQLAQQKLALKKLENESNKRLLIDKMHQITGVSKDALTALNPKIAPAFYDVNIEAAERPEIKALNEGILAKKYSEKAAYADYIPKIAAFGQYELRDKDLSLLDPKWAVGAKLQWNIFDGLAARNNARIASLEKQALQVQKHSAQEMIQLGYSKAKNDYLFYSDKVSLKKQEVNLAEDTYDFVNKQYINGLSSITELLDALNDLEKARFDYEQSIYEQRKAALIAADISGTLLTSN